MSDRSTGGLVLLLVGVLGLVGFLTGNLDRWISYLFSPGGQPIAATGATAPTSTGSTAGGGGGAMKLA